MDGQSVLVGLAMATAFLCAAIVFSTVGRWVRGRMRGSRMMERAGSGGLGHRLIRNGLGCFKPCVRWLLRKKSAASFCERVRRMLDDRGFASSLESIASLLCAFCMGLFALGAARGSWALGIALPVVGVAAISARTSSSAESRDELIRDGLPDALRAMSSCFHAGFTVQQTFGQLEREASGPVGALFGHLARSLETGAFLQEALACLKRESGVSELSFVAVALEVQHRTGGSMQHVLDSTCDSLESELELRRSLRVQTAQARLSARVVTGVTIGLVVIMALLSDGFLDAFFGSAVGLAMLALAIAMQVIGIVAVRKMLHVEVD
jgi:tight adherence protein B